MEGGERRRVGRMRKKELEGGVREIWKEEKGRVERRRQEKSWKEEKGTELEGRERKRVERRRKEKS